MGVGEGSSMYLAALTASSHVCAVSLTMRGWLRRAVESRVGWSGPWRALTWTSWGMCISLRRGGIVRG